MCLDKLNIYHVRNIQQQSIYPCRGINLIYGENGSGKSSLLEAIFILGRAKSFRSPSIRTVISERQKHLIISAQLSNRDAIKQIGIQMDGKNMEIHINQRSSVKRSELAYALPLQLIHPKSYELLDSGPMLRREFLDWGVFNHEKQFLPAWRNFKRVLSQRNSMLKNPKLMQKDVWDKDLAYYGTIIDKLRIQYLSDLKPIFFEIARHFVDVEDVELILVPGWNTKKALQEVLSEDKNKDLYYGFTHSGPHRADIQLLINKHLAKDYASRGQLKLLVLSLKLAQIKLLANQQGDGGCVLIDDFAAELDRTNCSKLLRFLLKLNCQVFVTATELTKFGDLQELTNYKLFHVEHGKITS